VDNSNDETGFRLDRSADGSNWSFLINLDEKVEAFSDSGLTPATSYFTPTVATVTQICQTLHQQLHYPSQRSINGKAPPCWAGLFILIILSEHSRGDMHSESRYRTIN
jgi:hypothetical protein